MTDTDKFVLVDMGIGQRITSSSINKIKKQDPITKILEDNIVFVK
jgi:hypothetical protein